MDRGIKWLFFDIQNVVIRQRALCRYLIKRALQLTLQPPVSILKREIFHRIIKVKQID